MHARLQHTVFSLFLVLGAVIFGLVPPKYGHEKLPSPSLARRLLACPPSFLHPKFKTRSAIPRPCHFKPLHLCHLVGVVWRPGMGWGACMRQGGGDASAQGIRRIPKPKREKVYQFLMHTHRQTNTHKRYRQSGTRHV
jgi:hypothetical protein